MRRAASSLVLVAALGSAFPAWADPAAAEALFQQGRELLERGELAAACAKFESSQASESSGGTLLNLADCRARQGKNATAWAHFVAAERLSELQGRSEQAAEARRRRTELEPGLSTLTVQVADAAPGLQVKVNGRALDSGSLDSRLPMDPGVLSIEFSAPERVPARVEVFLRSSAHHMVVKAPRLAARPAEPPAPKPAPAPAGAAESPRGSRTLAWVIGGFGATALAVGGAFGVLALSSNADAKNSCNQRTSGCNPDSLSAAEDRDRQALISTIAVATGLVGLGVSGVLLLTAPSPTDQSAAATGFRVELGPGRASISGSARF